MSLSGSKGSSSSGSRGNPPNGRKRKLSSRSHSLGTLHNSTSSSTRTNSSNTVKSGNRGKAHSSSPKTKKGRFVTEESSLSFHCDPMAFPSTSGASPFGNNFKGGGVNNHKRPGQGKKIIIKNRKGNAP